MVRSARHGVATYLGVEMFDLHVHFESMAWVKSASRPQPSWRHASRIWPAWRVVFVLTLALARAVPAQGVTSSGVHGRILAADKNAPDARVVVRHDGTGYSVESRLTGGRYFIQGLEPGGPYTIAVRALGFRPQRVERVMLALGQMREIDFTLEPIAARLDDIVVVARDDRVTTSGTADGGTGTTIGAAVIDRFPSLNRDLYDFVRLVPQISTKTGLASPAMSAAGAGFRYNNFVINGVSERTLSGGVSNAFGGLRSISLDAVQEYQVLIAPYDVRYGDFAGALVNTVTRSGTNDFRGSAFVYGRTDDLGRDTTSQSPYERIQYGFTLGGPIIRDRLHFFVAPELQHFTYPAPGPYVGQSPSAGDGVPVGAADLAQFDAIMRSYGLTPGSAGAVQNESPLRNLFMRLDLTIPSWRSRAFLWDNYTGNDESVFSRLSTTNEFPMSSGVVTTTARMRSTALHLHSSLGHGGAHNEFRISRRAEELDGQGAVEQPIVRVSVPTSNGTTGTITSGTAETAQGRGFRSSSISIKDDLSLPLGARHVLTLGVDGEWFRLRRGNRNGSYGTWSFASLDDFARGSASDYVVRVAQAGEETPLDGAQYGAYVGDRWQVTNRLSLTGGIRGDMLVLDDRPPHNPFVETIFARRTDEMPKARVEVSPRVGFVWDLDEESRNLVRGGAGVFASRYPLAWTHVALWSYGVDGTLRCNLLGSAELYPPPFNPDEQSAPSTCLGGSVTRLGDVDLADPDLGFVRVARGSLAYERTLGAGLRLTNEATLTRTLADVVFENLNLEGPQGIDPYGRVLYGTARPFRVARRSQFAEVIDVRNTHRGYSYQLSTKLDVPRARGFGGFVAYTFSRTRDVQTPLRVNNSGTTAWGSARTVSGRHDELRLGVSGNDIPHRIVVAGTYVAPWKRARTEASFYYVGESGRPFAYTAFASRAANADLNVDGSSVNDAIYVPNDARDPAEMLFSGQSDSAGADNSPAARAARELRQREAFEAFIDSEPCLRSQRGRIIARNSCREPWSNTTTASIRQAIPIAGQDVDLQLDVFNVLNVINREWGVRRIARTGRLEHVGFTDEPAPATRPIFRFPTSSKWLTQSLESAFQLQLALRYRF